MKFIHLADLHLGKRVNEFSMLEDQEYILLEILRIVDEEKPDAVTDYVEESHVDCSIKPRAFSRRITSSEREKQIIC